MNEFAVPDVAAAVFPDTRDTVARYAQYLRTSGVERGLIGPREVSRLWDRHILNCAVVTDLIDEAATVVDVGSGAGLPGLVMAIRRPDLRMTLLEPLGRRVDWLHEVIAGLELDNVEVVRARSEEIAGTRRFAVVTARAVARLAGLVPWTLPLAEPHGSVLAIKGAAAEAELAKAGQPLRSFGATSWSIETAGGSVLETPTRVIHVRVGQNGGKVPGRKKRHSG
ncbi:16S rRNA (guanine(527)-N(7))-methyltransferase RsmG [Spelaeicoccus albus]|uniref:Ribosomal RNA small subunit methyltransferase G n=1 Tax=Spelaeicoccus albus TaxID=1280376 RepID=A0A7Z0AAK3_9MICO|nr:16S rRNA (guanine(527)-N(7))-methyltransferase RsmG [Spelaeicoccus albus]NYI66585.1 16S rRNA (guanine527-N7)-methyltransferase [Spelaeicoccus albus]